MRLSRKRLVLIGSLVILLVIAGGAALFVMGTHERTEPQVVEEFATTTSSESLSESTSSEIVVADMHRCTGLPGPASDPLGGTVSLEVKEIAIVAMIHRNDVFLSNDASCIRQYEANQQILPEVREKMLRQTDDEAVGSAAFFVSLMPIPDAAVFRAQLLREDTEWTYKEGVLFFMVQGTPIGINPVVAQYEDGTILEPEEGGSWGASIRFYNGLWY